MACLPVPGMVPPPDSSNVLASLPFTSRGRCDPLDPTCRANAPVRATRRQHLGRIRRALQLLDAASQPADLRGAMRAKPLSVGPWAGYWSLRVTGNWRIVFRFEAGAVHDVDFVDYHGTRKRR